VLVHPGPNTILVFYPISNGNVDLRDAYVNQRKFLLYAEERRKMEYCNQRRIRPERRKLQVSQILWEFVVRQDVFDLIAYFTCMEHAGPRRHI
jgi:hypothetical protein